MRIFLLATLLVLSGCSEKRRPAELVLEIPSAHVAIDLNGWRLAKPVPSIPPSVGTAGVVQIAANKLDLELNAFAFLDVTLTRTVRDVPLELTIRLSDWTYSGEAPSLDDCVSKATGPFAASTRKKIGEPKKVTRHHLALANVATQTPQGDRRGELRVYHGDDHCVEIEATAPAAKLESVRSEIDAAVSQIWPL